VGKKRLANQRISLGSPTSDKYEFKTEQKKNKWEEIGKEAIQEIFLVEKFSD